MFDFYDGGGLDMTFLGKSDHWAFFNVERQQYLTSTSSKCPNQQARLKSLPRVMSMCHE